MSSLTSRLPAFLRNRKVLNKVGTLVAIRLAAIAVGKRLDLTRPETVSKIRLSFLAVQLASILVFIYVLQKIRAKNNQALIKVKPTVSALAKLKAAILKTITGKEQPRDPKADELIDTTVTDYDTKQAKGAIKGIIRSTIIMSIVAYYFGDKVLINTAMSRPIETLQSALFQLHIMDYAAVGSLARGATPEEIAEAEKIKAEKVAVEKGTVENEKVDGEVELDEKAAIGEVEVVKEIAEIVVNGDEAVLIEEKTEIDSGNLRQRHAGEL